MIDRLIEAIEAKKNPTVLGLDTRIEYFPEKFASGFDLTTFSGAADGIIAYNKALMDALVETVPAVKIQLAYYEMYGLEGLRAFAETVAYAKKKGFVVMVDGKRNDIGATATAYAAAYLGETPLTGGNAQAFDADYLTVNPYLGSDGVLPFVEACKAEDKGIFVLVKTSNPSSGQLQDLVVEGERIYQRVGRLVSEWGKELIGKYGYSDVGAVVGATYPEQGAELRKLLPSVFFLVPGYGAQGGGGKELADCFDDSGRGAIVNASRSLLCAYKKHGGDFDEAAFVEAKRMREDLAEAVALRRERS